MIDKLDNELCVLIKIFVEHKSQIAAGIMIFMFFCLFILTDVLIVVALRYLINLVMATFTYPLNKIDISAHNKLREELEELISSHIETKRINNNG